jgi:4-hydroxy-tetrahydrodipicolinate synthase
MATQSRFSGGVWSATPTPFTPEWEIDVDAVRRLVDHHLRLGVKGLFLCGTCGEGPWMPERNRRKMVETVTGFAKGKLHIAVQVTDNSAARIIDNMRAAWQDGADVAVIAPPFFLLNANAQTLTDLYRDAIRSCPLPVGIYDRGKFGAVVVPDEALAKIYAEKNVKLIKDSSTDPGRREIALAARKKRPELLLLNGAEFDCVGYLRAGYDGLLLGGGIFNGFLAGEIMTAVAEGKIKFAERLQNRMNRMMFDVYGGKTIKCWLSGQKKLLVEMGIFGTRLNYLQYPLTKSCERAIGRVLEREKEVLFP